MMSVCSSPVPVFKASTFKLRTSKAGHMTQTQTRDDKANEYRSQSFVYGFRKKKCLIYRKKKINTRGHLPLLLFTSLEERPRRWTNCLVFDGEAGGILFVAEVINFLRSRSGLGSSLWFLEKREKNLFMTPSFRRAVDGDVDGGLSTCAEAALPVSYY